MLTLVRPIAVVWLITASVSSPAWGTTIDTRPRPARLLAGGAKFLAQDSMGSFTLYSADGQAIHMFPTDGRPAALDVTADEKQLLLAGEYGSIGLWSVDTGQPVWRQTASEAGLDGVYDASLSADGHTCVICNIHDFALVLDAQSGRRIAQVGFRPGETSVMSAALAPDGRTGLFVDLGERVFAFDVASGAVRDIGLRGAWPIRYAADGKHAACRSNNSGSGERLRVITTNTWRATDAGQFGHIGHIRPLPGGEFQATGQLDYRVANTSAVVGVRYVPGSPEAVEVWRRPAGSGCDIRTDFGGDPVRGVSTSHSLQTNLVDLKTGELIRAINNSANYRTTIVSSSSSGPDRRWTLAGLGVIAIGLAAVLTLWLGRRK